MDHFTALRNASYPKKWHPGRNQAHLLDFMDRAIRNGSGGRFSFAYRDRATVSAVRSLERRNMIKVDWITHQISLD